MYHGQEIYLFFYRYGINGIAGIIVCNILMGFVIYKTLSIIRVNDIKTYKEFLDIITSNLKKSKHFDISEITNNIINIFLLVTFFVMISGFGAYFSQEYRNEQSYRFNTIGNNMRCCFSRKY